MQECCMNKRKLPREPLTEEQLEKMRSDDFDKVELTESEIFLMRKINEARNLEAEERAIRIRAEQQPILKELADIGYKVESLWDLMDSEKKYTKAIPILLKHLLLPYFDRTRDQLARALAVKEARPAWPVLVEQYRKTPIGKGLAAPGDTRELPLGAKSGLACALSVTVDESTMPTLISLIKDPVHGDGRILLLSALKKSKSEEAKAVLLELADDPVFKKEIASWRKKKS